MRDRIIASALSPRVRRWARPPSLACVRDVAAARPASGTISEQLPVPNPGNVSAMFKWLFQQAERIVDWAARRKVSKREEPRLPRDRD